MAVLFNEETVMVTGASAGFGTAIARIFAKKGARLILLARRQERLETLANELAKEFGTHCHLIASDIRDYAKLEDGIAKANQEFGPPSILINNAGLVRGLDKLVEIKKDAWDEMIDTNIKGVLAATRLVLPAMLEAGQGQIINVGSVSGHGTYPGGSVYCATKFALRAITDTLRMELIDSPIRVSLISPGMAETEFSLVRFYGDQEKAHNVYKGMQPLTADDIAEAIFFIASRPPHVNIADLIIYPKNQASTMMVHRQS
ncbi:MAG: SDR family NAD(P)-dependent oxidoreductase [Parachlamydia sp.]|jgi:hypothetical protein|nr:SDR family NAD(P)-dependent oxidoreductase [Parachlamydia sp.]